MSSPWAKIPQVEVSKLDKIMSEEVAMDMQNKEYAKYGQTRHVDEPQQIECDILSETACANDSASDAEIARMLQLQYDKEYDDILKREENKYNKSSKFSISFENYRRAPINLDFESDSEEEELVDVLDRKEWDRFDAVNKEYTAIPPCGYGVQNGKLVTKHDGTINGRRNAWKMMSSLPCEINTGDGAQFDLQLSNKVYNSLRAHSKQEVVRKYRLCDKREDRATAVFGMDETAALIVYKLINKQILKCVNGVISIGKEALILHAECDQSYPEYPLPKESVLKVFKTTRCEFKHRDEYVSDDYKLKDKFSKIAKKSMHLWAEKEMANLRRLKNAGVLCPEALAVKKHVLVMSLIGDNHKPAPKLKDATMSEADLIIAYEQVVGAMKAIYEKAKIIHADLSEYNILWFKGDCYFIDLSQSVEKGHENAFYFLMRDCQNITQFFERKGVSNVLSSENLFKEIVGCDYCDKTALLEIQAMYCKKSLVVNKTSEFEDPNYFEKQWERSQNVVAEPPKA